MEIEGPIQSETGFDSHEESEYKVFIEMKLVAVYNETWNLIGVGSFVSKKLGYLLSLLHSLLSLKEQKSCEKWPFLLQKIGEKQYGSFHATLLNTLAEYKMSVCA